MLHARTSNEKFLAFSPSDYSLSILTSLPLLSCHFGSTATSEIWRLIDFSKWRHGRSILLPVSYLLMSLPSEGQNLSTNQISSTSMVNIISVYGWDITTSGLEKQTPTILEFCFRFRSRLFSRNLHFILHQPAEFRPNRSRHYGNITSYRFIKMAAADAKYYFRFRICWYRCLQKVKVYEQTKFRRHMSIDGWD